MYAYLSRAHAGLQGRLRSLVHAQPRDGLAVKTSIEVLGTEDGWEEAGLTVEESMFAAFRQTVSTAASFRVEIERQTVRVTQKGKRVREAEIRGLMGTLDLTGAQLVG
jgi:hypothetical protein